MPGRGKAAGWKRRQSPETSTAASKRGRQESQISEETESLRLFDRSENQAGKVVDFEQLIRQSLDLGSREKQCIRLKNHDSIDLNDKPQLIRCGGDNLGMLTPDNLKTKIKQNEYINLANGM